MYRVFTKKGCGTCESVKYILKSKNISFLEIDLATKEGLSLAHSLNVLSAGTIIDEEDNIIPLASLK